MTLLRGSVDTLRAAEEMQLPLPRPVEAKLASADSDLAILAFRAGVDDERTRCGRDAVEMQSALTTSRDLARRFRAAARSDGPLGDGVLAAGSPEAAAVVEGLLDAAGLGGSGGRTRQARH